MKQIKKLFAAFLALTVALLPGLTVFAAGSYTITITPNPQDENTHVYEAYQIFKGDLHETDGKKILSNIDWGTGVDGAALLAELKASDSLGELFEDCLTAADAAEVLQGFENDAATTRAFADLVGKHLTSTTSGTYANNKISGLDAGYYLVKDQDDSLPDNGTASYTRYILGVVSDVTVTAKSEVPSVDKSIQGESGALADASTASIGDQIPYAVTSKVPDMTGYDKYYFVLNDTLSKGLTFNDDTAITIGDKTLVKDTDFTVSYSVDETTGKTTVEIVLKDFIQYQADAYKDADILVTYSATLNENADLTQNGNVNEVSLIFSNDPNYNYTGDPTDPDKPASGEPCGETPKDQTITYATAVSLTKIDGKTGDKLDGAKFSISGTALKVVLIHQTMFKESVDGTWYMLKDGTYTETEPTEATEDLYDSTTVKYEKVESVTKDTVPSEICAEGYVKNGVLTFEGLNAGTYLITELVAPDGYNLLSEPIELVIEGTPTLTGCAWTATVNEASVSLTNDVISFSVENKSGAELPSTGGIGTTIFYIVGALLVVGAGVILITRKRTNTNTNK